MKRREFCKLLASVPLLGAIPFLRAEAGPQNVAELTAAIEGLFNAAREMEPCAFVEYALTGAHQSAEPWYFYRVVPVTWRRAGMSEGALVRQAWREVRAPMVKHGNGTLMWRKRPYVEPYAVFETGERGLYLRFRAGVLPDDWQERARLGAQHEAFFPFEEEGAPTRRL